MRYAIRYPSKLMMFGVFFLLQSLLFIPAVIIFAISGAAHTFGGNEIDYVLFAIAITLLATAVFLYIGRREPASFVIPLSFAVFPYLLYLVFTVVTWFIPYDALPYEWGKYPKIIVETYTVPMLAVTVLIVSVIKAISRIKSRVNNKYGG